MAEEQKPWVEILVGDCIEQMRQIPDKYVHTCVTSPPYFGLRDYGERGQIGLEPTPEEFVAKLVGVFREVRRVLRDDGTLWLNLGDSYAGTGKSGGGAQGRRWEDCGADTEGPRGGKWAPPPAGLKPKDLIGIPWRVAFALQADGWYLRQDIIWHKPNPMPESVRDRCTKAHEYLFLLSKGPRYYFDHEAMQEPGVKGAAGSEFHTGKTGEHQLGRASTKPRKSPSTNTSAVPGASEHSGIHREGSPREPETRNRRDVWTVASQPFKGAHFATFPPALITPCVLAGCPIGGVVLDPFGGSGTTGMVSRRNGRNSILCELSPTYAEMAERRVNQ